MGKIIQFPNKQKKEGDLIRKEMAYLEDVLNEKLAKLQELNEDVLDLSVMYEDLLNELCELHGIEIQYPPQVDIDSNDFDKE